MPKINKLPKEVYNRIAAGEVIERPASVVKELVENSIDAGATEIEIYVEQGGKKLVRVVDNGGGIEKEDLYTAFMPHATSKISKADDLNTIATLGFRGEALASIGSVARVSITSKVAGEKCYRLQNNGGAIGAVSEAAGERVGTEIKVEELFFNTPVRLNFLKTDKGEETDITTFVSRFILNRPDIAFTYVADGKTVLQSFGGGDDEAFVSVYSAATLGQCYKIDAEKHGIRIRGYIGNQNFSKSNKSYQSVFLNGRYISNATISAAISSAYGSYLMKRQYPFYVLHISMPREVVDVNVHPNKADVRFADNGMVYGCIHSVITAVLDGNSKALDYVIRGEDNKTEEGAREAEAPLHIAKESVKETPMWKSLSKEILEKSAAEQPKETPKAKQSVFSVPTLSYEEAQKEIEACAPYFRKTSEEQGKNVEYPKGCIPMDQIPDVDPADLVIMTEEEMRRQRPRRKDPEKLAKRYGIPFERTVIELNDPQYESMHAGDNPSEFPVLLAKKETEEDFSSADEGDFFAENKRYLESLEKQAKQNRIEINDCKYAGKLFNTYLLYERNDEIYYIDQHAAHERLIFDRLKAGMATRSIARQPMLLPYELKVNAFEGDFLKENLENIRAMGFDIEAKENNVFHVTAVPFDLRMIELNRFFNEILAEINGYRAIKLEDILKDKLASAACKAAVKGGMDLTREEIDELFKLMDGNMGLKCPHGRPVVMKMTRTQLEKMFKRIV